MTKEILWLRYMFDKHQTKWLELTYDKLRSTLPEYAWDDETKLSIERSMEQQRKIDPYSVRFNKAVSFVGRQLGVLEEER